LRVAGAALRLGVNMPAPAAITARNSISGRLRPCREAPQPWVPDFWSNRRISAQAAYTPRRSIAGAETGGCAKSYPPLALAELQTSHLIETFKA